MIIQLSAVKGLLMRLWAVRACWVPLATWLALRHKRHRLYYWLLSLTSCFMMFEVYRNLFVADEHLLLNQPSLLIESKKSECLQYDDNIVTSSANTGSVAVVGWRSARTLDFLTSILSENSDAILVTSPEILKSERGDVSSKLEELAGLSRWHFLRANTQCTVDHLTKAFTEKGVHTVHVLYDETDFLPIQPSTETGRILTCYISLLEVLAKMKHVELYLHLKHQRNTPVLNYDSHLDNWVVEGHRQRSFSYDWRDLWFQPSCDLGFDYTFLYDVFLKTIDIYTTTYKNLYDMNPQVVVQG